MRRTDLIRFTRERKMKNAYWIMGLGVVLGIGIAGSALVLKRISTGPEKILYQLREDILVHGNPYLREIAFTFDDGPHPETMRELLNLLGREKVRSTFFLVGTQIEKSPAIVRRMLAEGHEVGNHTYTHPRLDGLSLNAIRKEMVACGHAFHKATGAYMHLFRPPGMRYDDAVIDMAQELGYVTIHWNAAAQDYQPTDPALIEDRVMRSVSDGSVVLLHDHPDTLRALPNIIRRLKEKKYRFVTVSQMLGRLQRPVYAKSNAYTGIDATKLVTAPPARAQQEKNSPEPHGKGKQKLTKPKERLLDSTPVNRGIDVPVEAGG